MRLDMTPSARTLADQADGLRRLFAGTRQSVVPLVANPHVESASTLLERLSTSFADLGANTLVVDAADTSPAPHEMAGIDLAACIEPLGGQVYYLAARGLPLQHVNARGSAEAWLAAVETAAPRADVIVLHASARDLVRLIGRRALRPVLMASLDPGSLTDAYTSMKLLAQRAELLSFDLLVGMRARPKRAQRIAERLASCGDSFLNAVLRGTAAVDCNADAPANPALRRLATDQLLNDDATLPVLSPTDALLNTSQAASLVTRPAMLSAALPSSLSSFLY